MPHKVRVRAGHPDLVLEDGTTLHQPGDEITLSDEAFARLPQSVFGTVLDDLGEVGAPGGSSAASATTPVAKTANYTAANGDAVLADASGGDFNVTLPAPANGAKVTVKNVGASGTVTVAHNGSEHIDGANTYVLASQYLSRDFLSDGTDWWVV